MKHLANNEILYSVQEPELCQACLDTCDDHENCVWPNLDACCDITRGYCDMWGIQSRSAADEHVE